MKIRTFLSSIIIIGILSFSFTRVSFAAPLKCEDTSGYTDNPALVEILCPFARVVNVLIFSAGSVFVVMIGIGSYKYAISMGDPQAAKAGQQTLTWAIIGLLVILMFYAILFFLYNALGFDTVLITPGGVLRLLQVAMCDLLSGGTLDGRPIVDFGSCH